ncbi:MAG: hypothetical protein J3R72DRAFT_53753 [Linnemannia gamsii]|nr:MAG: hypothetical protein J3R72DRAFT_53753 [Linnemannia gamsii]
MQDADEGTPTAATSVVVPSTAGAIPTVTTTTITTTTTTTTASSTESKDSLAGSMNHVSLQEESKSAAVDNENKSEEKPAEEPQGYQVCDFETGMCYWVPAKKSPDTTNASTPAPKPAAAIPSVNEKDVKSEDTKTEETKEDEEVKEKDKKVEEVLLAPPVEITTTAPAEDDNKHGGETHTATKNKKDDTETEAEPEGYEVCDFNTGMCYWIPAKKAKMDPEEVQQQPAPIPMTLAVEKEEVTTKPAATSLSSAPASGLDPGMAKEKESKENRGEEVGAGSGARTPVSGSESPASSPGSLNPGPRLVGKLSRDRLAMFENS